MIHCKSCDSAHLLPRRVYRRGSLAVFLGHSLLVPSILFIVFGSMGVVARRPGSDPSRSAQQVSSELEAAGIPASVAEDVASRRQLLEPELTALSSEQRQLVLRSQMSIAEESTRTSIERLTTGNGFRLLACTAVVSGILGWLLVRKRGVIQCANCGAVSALC